MKNFVIKLGYLFSCTLVCLFGCGYAGGGEPTILNIYVNASLGSDVSGNGSPSAPYRTITHALNVAQENYTINVAAGTYDSSSGEVFPLYLKPNITINGDVSNSSNASRQTLITGVGIYTSPTLGGTYSVAIICANDATISGFQITAINGVGIWCEGQSTTMTISKNIIINSDYGIVVSGSAKPGIHDNVISQNNISGIETFSQSMPIIEDNTITNNAHGITINNSSHPVIGTAVSAGNNTIANNTNCDLNNATSNQISAIGNNWDDDPFLFTSASSCSNGSNIANTAGGVVLYQYIPSSDFPIFPNSSVIDITLPTNGAVLGSNEPRFTWTATGNKYVMLGLFSRPVILQNNSIQNNTDLIWVWHSGIGKGREGDVAFNDGLKVINGNLDGAVTPTPLDRGRTYYLAIWAWDEEGLEITNSSKEFYFTVTN